MASICSVRIYVEMVIDGLPDPKVINGFAFQTKDIPFDAIVRIMSYIFSEVNSSTLLTSSYLQMQKQYALSFVSSKSVVIKVSKLKNQSDYVDIVTNISKLHRVLRDVYSNIMTEEKLVVRDDYLSYFMICLCDIVKGMRENNKTGENNETYMRDYVATIKTIDFIKVCVVEELEDCVDIYYMEISKKLSKFELYKEFLGIRKNRREEINYYLEEKRQCVQNKIIC